MHWEVHSNVDLSSAVLLTAVMCMGAAEAAGQHPADPGQAAAIARAQQGRHARRRHAAAAGGDAGALPIH